MRRVHNDTTSTSQATRNLVENPELVQGTADKLLFKNVMVNPSFEAASGTTTVQTNLLPNPGMEGATSPLNLFTNLATNPSFEATNGDVAVWRNLATNPTLEAVATGTTVLRRNLATAGSWAITAATGATKADGVLWSGQTWSRFTQGSPNNSAICRLNIPLSELGVGGTVYTFSLTLANDSTESVGYGIDWCDQGYITGTLAPGEVKRVSTTTSRSVYTSTHRFADLYTSAAGKSLLFKDVLVEQTDQLRPYFDGATADSRGWDYGWAGTAGASVSTASASATEVTRNHMPNPRMVSTSSVTTIRKNLCLNPRAVTAYSPYGAGTISTVSISGHPLGITTANRVSYGTSANNPGVMLLDVAEASTTYTLSAWVYHETIPSSGSQGFAQSGVVSMNPAPAFVEKQWQRLSWTYTTDTGTSGFGFRVSVPGSAGSYLITGVLIEKSTATEPYFDGGAPVYDRVNLIPNPTGVTSQGFFGATTASTSLTPNNSGGPTGSPYIRLSATGTSTGTNYFALAHGSTTESIWTPVTAGLTYTTSMHVRVTMTNFTKQPGIRLRWKRADGSTITDEPLVSASGTTSGQWVRLSQTGTAPAGAVYAELMGGYISIDQTTISIGDTIDISAVLVEQSATLRDYFDGNTTAIPGTAYAWTGAANASGSYAYQSDYTYGWGGTANSSDSGMRGTTPLDYFRTGGDVNNPVIVSEGSEKILRYIYRTGGTAIAVNSTTTSSNAAMLDKVYTVTAMVRTSIGMSGMRLRLGGANGPSFDTVAGQWKTVTFTSTHPNTGYTSVWSPSIVAASVGAYIDIKDFGVFEGTYKGAFFDGSNVSGDDFSYAWLGTPNNSQSVKRAPRPLNTGASKNTVADSQFYSISRYEDGTGWFSRYVAPAGSANSGWRIASSTGLDYANIVAGETYTFYARYRQSGWTNPSIMFGFKDATSLNPISPDYTETNVGSGWKTITRTFTAIAAGRSTTQLYISLPVIPPTDVDGVFDLDEWYLVSGTYTGPVFDGNSSASNDLTYGWAGVVDNSSSFTYGKSVSGISNGNVKSYQSSEWGIQGKSIKIIPLDVAGSNATSVSLPVSLSAGKTYTVVGTRYLNQPLSGTLNSAYAGKIALVQPGISTLYPTTTLPNVTGAATLRWTFTVDPAAVGHTLRVGHGGAVNSGSVWWDDIVVVEGNYTGPYFDGNTIPDSPDFTYEWSGAANASTSNHKGVNVVGWALASSAVTYQNSVTTPKFGTKCAAVLTKGAVGDGIYAADINATAGTTYTFASWVKTTSAHTFHGVLRWKDSASATITDTSLEVTSSLTVGSWSRVTMTATAPAGTIKVQPMWRIYATHTPTTFYVDGATFTETAVSVEYFDGSMPPSGDFTFAWTGTPFYSTSTKSAPAAKGWTGNYSSRVAWQSGAGPVAGKKSIAIASGYPSVDSFSQSNTIPFAGETLAGRTFTFIGARKTEENFTTTGSDGRAWRMLWQVNKSDGGYELAMPPIGPTTPGVHKMKYTHTFGPTATTSAFFRVYNGSATPGSVVWWDDIAIIEGAYPGEYFDGDTPDTADNIYAWEGDPTATASTMRSMDVKGTWGSNRAVFRSSTEAPFSGSASVKASVSALGYFPRVQSTSFPAKPGRKYTAFAKMKCSTHPVQIGLAFWGDGVSLENTTPVESSSNGNWVQAKTANMAPEGTTDVQVLLGVPTNAPLGTEFEIDSIFLTAGNYNGPFGSGDSYGWEWEGEPHASTSKGYPVGMMQLAGKPLFFQTTPGQYVLTDIDPAKNPVLPADAPRTIYTVVNNLKDIDTGLMSVVFTYGVDDLSDATHPNETLMLRQQSQAGSTVNATLTRRTGGGGPIALNTPSIGKQILISGLNENGYPFAGVNKDPIVTDTGVLMSVPHERIKIESNNTLHQHIATYIYPGVHSAAVRQEMVKLLAHEYSIPGM